MTFTRQSVRVNTGGPDQDGCLIFDATGALVAVLVRLGDEHDSEYRGKWYFEHGFGALDEPDHPLFDEIADAEAWITSYDGKPVSA